MKLARYLPSEGSEWQFFVLTDDEFRTAFDFWENGRSYLCPRLGVLLPSPRFCPSGGLPAWQGKEVFWDPKSNSILALDSKDSLYSWTCVMHDYVWKSLLPEGTVADAEKVKQDFMPIDEAIRKGLFTRQYALRYIGDLILPPEPAN